MPFERVVGFGLGSVGVQVLLCLLMLHAVPGAAQDAPASGVERNTPFESVRPAPEPGQTKTPQPQPGQQPPSPFEAPKPAAEAPPPAKVENVIEAIEFRGARRVPADTLRAMIFSRRGDKLDEDVLRRDFMALWNTGRFDDIRLEVEPGKTGQIVRFVLQERQMVRSIKYEGIKSVTVSEILDRF
ncbi:MAG TPA: POTRA domain-containing protein, partial [Bryobacteraceae bacterium]|nr:POTRA domain-containing protein [Bryobacteraceae bacterium]